MRRFLILTLPVFAVLLALDQWVKITVEQYFALGESLPLLPFFSLTYVRNTGAAWGMFSGAQLLLAFLGFTACVLAVLFRKHFLGSKAIHDIVLGLLLSGIVGNLIDRLRLDYVVDFLHVHWNTWHFPCFNIADSAICVAAFCIIAFQFIPGLGPADSKK